MSSEEGRQCGRKRSRADSDDGESPTAHTFKVRVRCALGYNVWVSNGSKKSESPFSAWEKESVPRQLPARWLLKFHVTGSVLDSARDGRPLEFGDEANSLILEIELAH